MEMIPRQVRSLEERMQVAIDIAKANDNTLVRYPGGFWSRSGLKTWERPWVGPSAIQELVARGVFAYSADDHDEVILIEV